MFKKYDKTCPDCVSSQVKINSAVNAELRKELVSAGNFCADQEDGAVEVAPLCKKVGMG